MQNIPTMRIEDRSRVEMKMGTGMCKGMSKILKSGNGSEPNLVFMKGTVLVEILDDQKR